MKKLISILLAILLIATFAFFAIGSGEDETVDQGDGSVADNTGESAPDAAQEQDAADTTAVDDSALGEYSIVIDSCRLATDYEGKPVVIVKYVFTNVSDEDAISFSVAIDDNVYQNGIGLNSSYVVDDSADYSIDNQSKEIKAGASLDVEVAYELNDTTTPIEVEVKEWISFDDKTITKTFTIA